MLVTAADIARLVGYGRAAVSNWRRRYDDFPKPVAGTASSPLFSLPEIESWLAGQGRAVEISERERFWQRIRTRNDDLQLGTAVGQLGLELLARGRSGDGETYEFVVSRFAEAHSRRLAVTPARTARLMADLADVEGREVYDPACGLGTLLIAAWSSGAARVSGQDREDYASVIARARLALARAHPVIETGASLKYDALPDRKADVVLCDPPFGDRSWGHEALANDPRWVYGLPPKAEGELAWLQHALWHLREGGLAAVLLPAAVAHRRSGRRIREKLVHTGALRAVIELSSGSAAASVSPPHLWILRRPLLTDRSPRHVLMVDGSGIPVESVVDKWRRFEQAPDEPELSGWASRSVPIVGLLDEVVDLRPSTHLQVRNPVHLSLSATKSMFRERLKEVSKAMDTLSDLVHQTDRLPTTSVAELLQSGAVTQLAAPLKMRLGEGSRLVLTAKDVISGRPPSERTRDTRGLAILEPDDVVIAQVSGDTAVTVITEKNAAAGQHLQVLRPDPDRCDPYFLACFLQATVTNRRSSSASRLETRRFSLPRLPIDTQRLYGSTFRDLKELSSSLSRLNEAGEEFVQSALQGMTGGRLCPKG